MQGRLCAPLQPQTAQRRAKTGKWRSCRTKRSGLRTPVWVFNKRGKSELDAEGRCPKCGKKGSCGVYWYKFMWKGKLIREPTKQGNDKVARQMESAHRTSLAKGEVGIRERKPSPTLVEFMLHTFQPWVEATFREKPRTAIWYRGGIRRLSEFPLLAKVRLSEITLETVHAYIVKRQTDGLNITSINRELQILRRILRLGVEWGTVQSTIKVKLLPGKRGVNASLVSMKNQGT